MSGINLFNFLVTKPWVWLMTHLEGSKAEESAAADIEALEPEIISAAQSLFNGEVGKLLASDGTLSEAGVTAALAPEVGALASTALTALAGKLSVPASITTQLVAYVTANAPTLISAAYKAVAAATTTDAPASAASATD